MPHEVIETTNPDGTKSRSYKPEDELKSPTQPCTCKNCGSRVWLARPELGIDPTDTFMRLGECEDPDTCPKCP
jgi:hypothetical protein